MAHKDKVKALIGGGLNAYHQGVKNQINRINKESLKQNHVINVLSQDLTKDYITKTEEGSYIDLDHSKDGMIFLDKIKGKTFINLCDYSVFNDRFENHYYNDRTLCETSKLKLNTYYTVVIFKQFNSSHSLNYNVLDFGVGNILNAVNGHPIMTIGDSSVNQYRITYNNNKSEVLVQKIKFQDFKGFKYFSWRPCRRDTAPVVGEFADYNIKIVLLEGDHTQNPPKEYFEGFASVGSEVDEIEVSSVKADRNLFDKSSLTEYIIGNDAEGVALDYHRMYSSGYKFHINTDDVITFSYKCKETTGDKNPRFRFVYTDGSQASIHALTSPNMTEYTLTSNSQKKISHIEVVYSKALGNWIVDLDSIMVNKGSQPIPHQPYEEDKKPVLFRDTDGSWKPISELKGLIEVCDTIELHNDGKYYYHIRIAEKTFNGADEEDWRRLGSLDTNNTERYAIYVNDVFLNSNGICDKIPYVRTGGSDTATCIYVHNTDKRIDVRRLKTDNRWSDVATFKTWLKANNLTIIYQLAEEVIFEVDPITLICYANSALLTNTNIAPTITARYSGQAPVLFKARKTKALSKVNSVDIEENIVPYLMDMDYRVAILQLNSGQAVAAYKSLGNTFDMLKRDILTNRYSKEEYLNRIEVYLNINRITQEEYEKLGELLNG